MQFRSWSLTALLVCLVTSAMADPLADASPTTPRAAERMQALGDLGAELELWLPLETTERGGLEWCRRPTKIVASKEVVLREADGRKWLDFQEAGAVLTLKPTLPLPEAYTLCTWALLPAAKGHGLIWQGTQGGGAALFTTRDGLFGWVGQLDAQRRYGALPPGLSGWHHLAISCDGKRTQAFLDGALVGTLDMVVETDLVSIGSHWMVTHQNWMMSDGLRAQYLFHRALTEEEVKRVLTLDQ